MSPRDDQPAQGVLEMHPKGFGFLRDPKRNYTAQPGDAYVSNPAWSPNGQFVAFAWTKGYEPGNYNIFVMDIARRVPVQLTHGAGRNENPWWGPDGVHLVFSSKRGRLTELYTMLADGSHVQQLTTQGDNLQPVWSKAIN